MEQGDRNGPVESRPRASLGIAAGATTGRRSRLIMTPATHTAQCRFEFGFCAATWHKARLRGEIRSRPLGKPIEILLRTSRSRISIKRRLLKALVSSRTDATNAAFQSGWGQPLSCHIDHINGVKDDHRLEICECSAQTATARPRPTVDETETCDGPCKTRAGPCSITVAAVPGSSNGRMTVSESVHGCSSPLTRSHGPIV